MDENTDLVIYKRSNNRGTIIADSQGRPWKKANPVSDIVFVIDTTGSMNDKILGLLQTCQKFVDEIAARNIDWRIATVTFGDLKVRGDTIQTTGFSNKLETVKHMLANVPRNNGGGNNGESSLEALDKAFALNFRPNAIKVFVFMTDEPAHRNKFKPNQIIGRLRQSGVLTFVISDPIDYFKRMASETGGKWFKISSDTNFLSILDDLFKKVTETVVEVQTLGGGNVQTYLQLKSDK